ncbi:SAM-dependent methyltransferase [Kribbella sp. NBC_01245]|uniref:class I SAM-dependent methyltransferase n=1 Tax=Kribbella sp. NBC_01245 TaxID=2903578 RepID=UPI002E29A5F8|nr:SAM-dependent methyltransferase [Kribbella sp. NBC_01245]
MQSDLEPPTTGSEPRDEVRAALLDESALVRALGSGRRRGAEPPAFHRVELRYVDLKAGRHLQLTQYDERQAHTSNAAVGAEAAKLVDELLDEPYGNWHVETTAETLQFRYTKKGRPLLHRQQDRHEQVTGHDRPKERLLDPAAPFLIELGISDHHGRVKPSRQSKYKQIEEFCKLLAPALDEAVAAGRITAVRTTSTSTASGHTASGDAGSDQAASDHAASGDAASGGDGGERVGVRPLHVVDLGCGNAYLTLAAYHLLSARGYDVRVTGIDHNPKARVRNSRIVADLGWQEQLRFVDGTIAEAELDSPADVVLALHACDTATDDALARAVGWEAPLVLAAPCCHHDIQKQLKAGEPPAPYSLLTRYGIVRERFADLLTDTLRAAVLRQVGYRVEVVQFVDSEHTPRNLLLRAARTGAAPDEGTQAEYAELIREWQVQPRLADLVLRPGADS